MIAKYYLTLICVVDEKIKCLYLYVKQVIKIFRNIVFSYVTKPFLWKGDPL